MNELKAEIKTRQYFALAFGSIIGIGWIVVLGTWIAQAGPLGTLIGFLGGAVVVAMIGLCYAEAASMFPSAGGEVVYTYFIFGPMTSFLTGWLLALVYIAISPFEAVSLTWIMGEVFPGFEGPELYTSFNSPVNLWSLIIGISFLGFITFINFKGVRWMARMQEALTYTLVAISLIFIVFALINGETENLKPFFSSSASSQSSPFLGILAIFSASAFWFAGFDTVPQAMGERENNSTLGKMGKVIVGAISAACVFYVLVILVSAMALPRNELLSLDLPVAGVFTKSFNSPFMAKLVLISGAVGLLTTWNAVFYAGSRVVYILGKARLISPVFGELHSENGTPTKAILFVSFFGCVGIFIGRDVIELVVNISALSLAMIYTMTCIGVLILRRKEPNRKRPYRAPGGMPLLISATAAGLFMIGTNLYGTFKGSEGVLPIEIIGFGIWLILGIIFWNYAKNIRNHFSEENRKKALQEG